MSIHVGLQKIFNHLINILISFIESKERGGCVSVILFVSVVVFIFIVIVLVILFLFFMDNMFLVHAPFTQNLVVVEYVLKLITDRFYKIIQTLKYVLFSFI